MVGNRESAPPQELTGKEETVRKDRAASCPRGGAGPGSRLSRRGERIGGRAEGGSALSGDHFLDCPRDHLPSSVHHVSGGVPSPPADSGGEHQAHLEGGQA
jgi:hypothetical protein